MVVLYTRDDLNNNNDDKNNTGCLLFLIQMGLFL